METEVHMFYSNCLLVSMMFL